jgi:hypothetical protein
MRTSFMWPDLPLLIVTADLRHPKRAATSAIYSSLAHCPPATRKALAQTVG